MSFSKLHSMVLCPRPHPPCLPCPLHSLSHQPPTIPPLLPVQLLIIPNKRLGSRPCLCHGKLCPARSCPPLTLNPTPRALLEETMSRDEQAGPPCLRPEENSFSIFILSPKQVDLAWESSFPVDLGASRMEVSLCFPVCLCPGCPLLSPPTSQSCSLACQNSLPHS